MPATDRLLALLLGFLFSSGLVCAKDRWTELNLGPFYVDTDFDPAGARDVLTQLEQVRWVLGGLLESKDLPSLWPIRFVLTRQTVGTNPTRAAGAATAGLTKTGGFVWQNGQYLLVSSNSRPPLGEVAGLLLDANTPRLPPEVESGIRSLFSTLEAHGSRVTWGKAAAAPDLAWARMQLFATRFEYGASFHIFLTALKGGSTFAAAERNAFNKPPEALESEARANLAAGNWQSVPVSGRPLDPKRDFGEHTLNPAEPGVYLADWATAGADPKGAEAAYKAAVEAGGSAAALGYEGLGQLALRDKQDASVFWEDAIRAGSKSAPVYLAAAEGQPASEALPLLKRAAQLNPLWAKPVYLQAQLAETPAQKESLLKQAVQLDPRSTPYWVELAQLETTAGEATAAQGSWLRAEDSAPDDPERDRVHQLRLSSEQERLDAADARQRRERDAPRIEDEQAQRRESERIRAAERRANQSLQAAAGDTQPPEAAVPWSSLTRQLKLAGSLTRVDCFRHSKRLTVTDRSGKSTQLLLKEASGGPELSCGPQAHPARVQLEYRAAPDEETHTAGEITSLEIR